MKKKWKGEDEKKKKNNNKRKKKFVLSCLETQPLKPKGGGQ